MKLGILRTDTVRPELASEYGQYPDMFRRLLSAVDPNLEFVIYDVEHGEYPADIDAVDAYLITGSKASVYDEAEWIKRLMEFVRELHARRKKLVGICFGHQLVAHALGGRTAKSPKGWGAGVHTHRFHSAPAWHDGGNAAVSVLVSHQDQVVDVAPGSTVLAGSDFCEYAVTQIGDHILTFQGHPEFVSGYSREVMQFRREMLGEETYREGMQSLAIEPESERVARWIINFLNQK
tara:strand:+ start:1480 stop:2184 length:705 start_codon:yes stop_codon:yes gene_type:complete